MTTDTLFAAAAASAPRLDFYADIHKALRSFMADTLLRCGRLDVHDADEFQATLGQLDALLTLCGQHLQHENDFVHPAIEARCSGGSRRIAGEHVEHLHHIDALRHEADQLRQAAVGRRAVLALRLYRHLALFVADNFQHMHVEETAHNAALWAAYTDAELMALHNRLMASLSPMEVLQVARWMLPALSPQERAALLNGIRLSMPPKAFVNLVDQVRPLLDQRAWAKLAPAIGMAQQPGQVDVR